MKLSVVVPCYNEEDNVPLVVEAFEKVIDDATDVELEVCLVNNGSKDETGPRLAQATSASRHHKQFRVVTVPENQGYGFGILSGLKAATGDVLSWTHADLQTDPKDVLRAAEVYRKANDENLVVKGARKNRPLLDAFFTWGMQLAVFCITGRWLPDINAQPKLFSRAFYQKHISEDAPWDFSLDLYLLAQAQAWGRITSIPVFFATRKFGEAKGGGSMKVKWKLVKRTFAYILERRHQLRPRFKDRPILFNSLALLSVAFIGLLAVYIPYHHDPLFFFRDDKQTEYIPKFMEMGRMLRAGDFPYLTTKIVLGGNFLFEHQYGLFNPLNLALYASLNDVEDLAKAAAYLAAPHTVLLGWGTYFLSREAGMSRTASVTSASVMCTNAGLLRLGSIWVSTLHSIAWFPFPLLFAFRLQRKVTSWNVIGMGVFTYLMVTAGSPLTDLAMVLCMATWCVFLLLRRQWLALLVTGFAFALGIVGAFPSLQPLSFAASLGERIPLWEENGKRVVGWDAVWSMGMPAGRPFIAGATTRFPNPEFYVAWYIVPALFLVNWQKFFASNQIKRFGWSLVALLAVTLLLAMGPSPFGNFRYPVRNWACAALFATLLLHLALDIGGVVLKPKRVGRALLWLILYQSIGLAQRLDRPWDEELAAFLSPNIWAIVAGIVVALAFVVFHFRSLRWTTVILSILGIFAINHRTFPLPDIVYDSYPRSPKPTISHGLPGLTAYVGSRTRFDGEPPRPPKPTFNDYPTHKETLEEEKQRLEDEALWYKEKAELKLRLRLELLESSQCLLVDEACFNGYSPIGNRLMNDTIPLNLKGNVQKNAMAGLAQLDVTSGLRLWDLMQVQRYVIKNEDWKNYHKVPPFSQWRIQKFEEVRVATNPRRLEPRLGSISFMSSGLSAAHTNGRQRSINERWTITNKKNEEGIVIFSRPFFPGYRATLDGEPLEIERHRGFLTRVKIPPHAKGKLKLYYYHPAGHLAYIIAGLAAVLLLVLSEVGERLGSRLSGKRQGTLG